DAAARVAAVSQWLAVGLRAPRPRSDRAADAVVDDQRGGGIGALAYVAVPGPAGRGRAVDHADGRSAGDCRTVSNLHRTPAGRRLNGNTERTELPADRAGLELERRQHRQRRRPIVENARYYWQSVDWE